MFVCLRSPTKYFAFVLKWQIIICKRKKSWVTVTTTTQDSLHRRSRTTANMARKMVKKGEGKNLPPFLCTLSLRMEAIVASYTTEHRSTEEFRSFQEIHWSAPKWRGERVSVESRRHQCARVPHTNSGRGGSSNKESLFPSFSGSHICKRKRRRGKRGGGGAGKGKRGRVPTWGEEKDTQFLIYE